MGVLALATGPFLVPSAQAQSGTYLESRYDYCQERARAFSGYDGPLPERGPNTSALEGAAKGAGLATLGSVLSGESGPERRRSQAKGALFGGLLGALRGSEEQQEQGRKARIYQLEFDACMRANR